VYGTAAKTLISIAEEVDFVIFLLADNSDLVDRFGVTEDRCTALH
jgi:hypothetical protein